MHVPVLVGAVEKLLRVRYDGVYVDCTVGFAGHSVRIAESLITGRLIALDRDRSAIEGAQKRLSGFTDTTLVHSNYAALGDVLNDLGIQHVDGILIDAGVSSMQLDEAGRGFSFQREGPLDMRMDTLSGETAEAYLHRVDEQTLVDVLRRYGGLRRPGRLAKFICQRRDRGMMHTTTDLAEAVSEALEFVSGIPDETRTVFQAIRIAVNEELDGLKQGIDAALKALAIEGRLVVISFHSGEDRIVKHRFREVTRRQRSFHVDGRTKETLEPQFKGLTPKPVVPEREEVRRNPRAASAKLRAVERIVPKGG